MRDFATDDEVEVQEWNGEWVRGRVLNVEPCLDTVVITALVPPVVPDKPDSAYIKRNPDKVRHVSVLVLLAEAAQLRTTSR